MKQKKVIRRLRIPRGASLALVAVCAALLIVCVVGCFQLAMILGGAQELNYTADAAALNIAKRSMDIKIDPNAFYADCADSSGAISLANVNRVWGKAFLINANIEEMTANQELTNLATTSGNNAFTLAQQVNDSLCAKVGSMPILNSFFNQIAGQRLNRMLGQTVVSGGKIGCAGYWHSSMVYRGDASNLSFNSNQIPGPANANIGGIRENGKNFLQGYTPMQVNNKSFCFVAFRSNEMPHLISESFFKRNTPDQNELANIANPLPNAFAGYGKALNSKNTSDANAYAIANPQRQYNLAIPFAFVSINVTNLAYWTVQGKLANTTTYGFVPETQWGAVNIPLDPTKVNYLNGYASLGNEFKGNTLWAAINSVQGDSTTTLNMMLQKIQEIQPGFTQSNLQQLLQQQVLQTGVNNYLIYPKYVSPDNTNPAMQIGPVTAQTIKTLPKWLNVAGVNEGQPKTLLSQEPTQDEPNYDWEMVFGPAFQASNHWTEVSGELNWNPGTGYNQTLGRLIILHTTNCYFTAQPK